MHCYCVCRYAIRENIEKDIEWERLKAENPDSMEEDAPDPVPSITRAHFEEAMKYARRSVSDADIRKYQVRTQFRLYTGLWSPIQMSPSVRVLYSICVTAPNSARHSAMKV